MEGVVDLDLRGPQDHHHQCQACVFLSFVDLLKPRPSPDIAAHLADALLGPPTATTTTTTSQWVAPKTTTTTQAPKKTQEVSSSSASGQFSGRATFYSQGGAAGSCGNYASDSDYVVAVNAAQMNSGWCGKTVKVTNTANGKSITATVADTCPGCGYGSLDLSTGGESFSCIPIPPLPERC